MLDHTRARPGLAIAAAALGLAGLALGGPDAVDEPDAAEAVVRCANLVYGTDGSKTSLCFSDGFLRQIREDTNIVTHPRFQSVALESEALFDSPFAVMSGEGSFLLTEAQRENLRHYLTNGGFLVASAGCSSRPWSASFRREMRRLFPDREMSRLPAEHPVFHTVRDITRSRYRSGGARLPHLEGLTMEGRIVLIWSPDGLNDTGSAGGDCCCCGGNEIQSAGKLNVNILAYALTH